MTPEQIEAASFSVRKKGGYSEEEVDRFKRTVADDMRALQARAAAAPSATNHTGAQGNAEDLEAASLQMAELMREVHASLGEKRRVADAEIADMRARSERESSEVIASAAEQAEGVRQQADKVLVDAESHAELLRSDAEQRVREQCQETLRAARAELQDLLRVKHDILHALGKIRSDVDTLQASLEHSALSPEVLEDSMVDQTLIDLRPSPPPPPQINLDDSAATGHPSRGD